MVHALEATVLHSFAVSNRRGIFVYKDETGSIFYMSLRASGGAEADGKVELLVHGVHEPGPSVTMQLRMLLQRRLLLIAVDMLSSVLTKNPHFNWKQADLDFLRDYEKDWTSLEEEKSETCKQDFVYEFPDCVYDPLLVLFMFRQNLCGSTFFHRLHELTYEGDSRQFSTPLDERMLKSGGVQVNFNEHDFTLYYNYAPSKLDPDFQGVSTLTDKGAKYCRQAGTGIAIIELSLLHSDGTAMEKIDFGLPVSPEFSRLAIPLGDLRIRKLEKFVVGSRSYCVRVRIIDTALKRQHLHDWIALTLNQSVVSWVLERLLEKSKRGILNPIVMGHGKKPKRDKAASDLDKQSVMDSFRPGLPALISVLESAHNLPHPAVAKIELEGVIRASSVATATLDLLENGVVNPILSESRVQSPVEALKANLIVVRSSRSERPCLVRLEWSKARRSPSALVSVVSEEAGSNKTLRDSPIDCPEYIAVNCIADFGDKIDEPYALPKLYREVMIDDGTNERSSCVELLQKFKKRNPDVFRRSFAFVLSVKRNRRSLWAYNLNPQVLKS